MRFYLFAPRIMGFRPGISISPADIARLVTPSPHPATSKSTAGIVGSFVYVIEDGNGRVKIGTSKDPVRRLAQLRSTSVAPLSFAYIGVTPSEGYDIESATHRALAGHRVGGEWFNVRADEAVAAIAGAAFGFGYPILQLSVDQAARTVARARAEDAAATRPKHGGGLAVLLLIGMWVAATLLVAWIAVRL
jgi:hypothetical protein